KASRSPHLRLRERESRAEVECGRKHGDGDNPSARKIEVMDESVAKNAPQQTFKRNRAQPTQASGKKVKQRRDECQKPNPAQQLCNRRNHFQGSEPADSQSQSKHWQQERANPKKLQEQVRAEGTYYANPISRHARAGQYRG